MRRSRNLLVPILIAFLSASAPNLISAPTTAPAGPRIVLIIRHAEKPSPTEGEKDPDLTKAGYARADALAHVIPDAFPRPDFLFASKRSKNSNRPVETIIPLSKALQEEIVTDFKDDDYPALAKTILTDEKYAGKVVLISWHHGKIPQLAKALGVKDAPQKWDANVFDRVWEINYDHGTANFENLPQKAMPGDEQK
jgi:phosphohistidine phosphatase SixA